MFLRDLIFGRKSATRAVSAPAAESGADPAPALAPPCDMPDPAALGAMPDAAPATDATAGPLDAVPADPGPTAHGTETRVIGVLATETPSAPRPVSRRLPPVLGLMVGGAVPRADRQRRILDELSCALSLREIALVGTDRSARILVANRRVLKAEFSGATAPAGFDLRHESAAEDPALALHQAFADLVASPVDLLIEARAAAGVYAADGGLPVELLGVETDALRAAYLAPQAEPERVEDRTVA
jgi:hypothetical protein